MESKPRIAVCIGSFEYGGQGTVVEQELINLREHFNLTLVSQDIRRPIPSGVMVAESPVWSVFPLPPPELVKFLKGFDLIHCHDSLGLMIAAERTSRPVVVTSHGIAPIWLRDSFRSRLAGLVTLAAYPYLYRRARAVVAISAYIAAWLKTFARVEATTIRNGGIDAQVGRINPPRNRNLLYVGAIEPRKGIHDLLASLKYAPADVTLDLVGSGDTARYTRQAIRESIMHRVRFHGVIDQASLNYLYSTAFCTCSASHWEGFGLPTLEGFAFGRPALVRDQGGLGELIGLSGAGFCFRRVEEFASSVDLVSDNWKELSRRALAFAKGHLWSRSMTEYAELFHELLGDADGRPQPTVPQPVPGSSQATI